MLLPVKEIVDVGVAKMSSNGLSPTLSNTNRQSDTDSCDGVDDVGACVEKRESGFSAMADPSSLA